MGAQYQWNKEVRGMLVNWDTIAAPALGKLPAVVVKAGEFERMRPAVWKPHHRRRPEYEISPPMADTAWALAKCQGSQVLLSIVMGYAYGRRHSHSRSPVWRKLQIGASAAWERDQRQSPAGHVAWYWNGNARHVLPPVPGLRSESYKLETDPMVAYADAVAAAVRYWEGVLSEYRIELGPSAAKELV